MAKSRARKLADLIVGAGIDIDGNLTFDGGSTSADLTFADNDKANFGDASDLQIYHDGSSNLIQGSNGSLYIQAKAGENSILATPDGGVNLYHDNSLKFETTSSGAKFSGTLTADDNQSILLGTGSDLRIKHDGTDSIIADEGGGDLIFKAYDDFYFKQVTDDANILRLNTGGNATFYGNVALNQDNSTLSLGASSDLSIFHDGTDSFIKNDTGQLILRIASVESALVAVPNGAVSLYYDNSAKLATTSTGIQVTGNIDFPSGATILSGGTNTDMTIGTSSSGSTGLLKLQSTGDIQLFQYGTSWTTNVTFKGDGNVGIGTESPEQKLHVNGTVKIGDTLILREDGTNDLVQSTGNVLYLKAPEFNFQDNSGNQQFYTTSSRNFIVQNSLGVGTNSLVSGAQLTLGGGSRIAPVSGNGLNLAAGGSDRMFISTGGNVGIGTTSPTTSLHVERSSGNATQILNATGNNTRATIETKAKTSGGVEVRGVLGSYGDATKVDIGTLSNHNLSILTNNTERVRFMASGNVGIGTTSPQEKLQINGNLRMFSAGYPLIDIGITTSNYFRFLHDNPNDMFKIGKNGAATLNIAGSGNVGIGTSPAQKLDVNGKIRFTPNTADTNYSADIGALYNSTHPFELSVKNNGSSAEYLGVYADSGGANNRVVFPTGNVGIGTTSPSAKLHINAGEIRIASSSAYNTHLNYQDTGVNIISQANSGTTEIRNSSSTLFYLNASGKVGIGTTAPSEMLQINSADSAIRVNTTNAVNNAELQLLYNNNLAHGMILHYHGNSAVGSVDNTYPRNQGTEYGDIRFRQSYAGTMTEHMRLTAYDGYLGVLTANPKARLELNLHSGADSSLMNGSTTNDVQLLRAGYGQNAGTTSNAGAKWGLRFVGRNDNTFDTGKSGAIYAVSEDALGYNREVGLAFHTSPFDAGNTERMRITSTGEIRIDGGSDQRPVIQSTNWGYSSGYRVALLGSASTSYSTTGTGSITLSMGYDPSSNTNSAFTGDGREILFRRGAQFVTPNSSDNSFYLYNLVLKDGNVGIGTTSPAGLLHLRGTTPHLYIQSDDGQSAKLLFGDATDNSRGGIEYMSTDDMKFMNNNLSTVMTLRYTGQVGIGETNPNQDAAVEIAKAAPNTGVTTLRLTNSVNNKGQRIDFEDDNTARAFTLSHDNGSNITYMGNLVNEPFAFYTNNIERMRIQSGGDVRIGDTDGSYNSNSTSYIPFNTSGRFVTISDDDGAFLNLQSETTSSEQLGGILWTNRTGASDAHRQVASIDATSVNTTDSYEGGQLRFWTKVAGSANSQPGMIITHNRVVKGNDSEFLGFEDAINILNADPEDGGTDFDQTPTNNSDGGGTTWEISNNGDAIYFSSTSGGHGGTWMKVYCDAGLWAIKGSVRLTNTDGAIHPSTSSANYKFTHSFQFSISSGPDTGTLKWDADAAASNTGTDFTRAAFSSAPVYMSGGYKTITYQTNGYNGVQRIYITDLQLVKVG